MERMRVRRELACFCVDGGFLATLIGKVAEIRYQLGSLPDGVSVKYDTIFDPMTESIEMRVYLEEFETDEEYQRRCEFERQQREAKLEHAKMLLREAGITNLD